MVGHLRMSRQDAEQIKRGRARTALTPAQTTESLQVADLSCRRARGVFCRAPTGSSRRRQWSRGVSNPPVFAGSPSRTLFGGCSRPACHCCCRCQDRMDQVGRRARRMPTRNADPIVAGSRVRFAAGRRYRSCSPVSSPYPRGTGGGTPGGNRGVARGVPPLIYMAGHGSQSMKGRSPSDCCTPSAISPAGC